MAVLPGRRSHKEVHEARPAAARVEGLGDPGIRAGGADRGARHLQRLSTTSTSSGSAPRAGRGASAPAPPRSHAEPWNGGSSPSDGSCSRAAAPPTTTTPTTAGGASATSLLTGAFLRHCYVFDRTTKGLLVLNPLTGPHDGVVAIDDGDAPAPATRRAADQPGVDGKSYTVHP